MHKAESFEWDMNAKPGNFSSKWFYTPTKADGLGLSPIITTLKAKKLSMLRSFFQQHQSPTPKRDWQTIAAHCFKTAIERLGSQSRIHSLLAPSSTKYTIRHRSLVSAATLVAENKGHLAQPKMDNPSTHTDQRTRSHNGLYGTTDS